MIPQELKDRPQWVVWRREERNGKGTKIPYDARRGAPASSTDPTTWCSYQDAADAAEHYDGIGFVFSAEDDYLGVDLDDCLNDVTGELSPWAKEILDRFNSYAEISPSGKGIKIFARAQKSLERGRSKRISDNGEGIEIYSQGRYFTVTGNEGAWNTEVREVDSEVDWLIDKHWPRKESSVVVGPVPALDSSERTTRARAYLSSVEPAVEGKGGDAATYRVACKLVVDFDMSPSDALPVMLEWNQRCEPPWDERALHRKLVMADENESGPRGRLIAEPEPTCWDLAAKGLSERLLMNVVAPSMPKAPKRPNPFPAWCLDPPGLIGEFIRYTLDTSIYPQPELALTAAIAFYGAVLGRKVRDKYNSRTNLYMIGLGKSGCGKERARQVCKELVIHAELTSLSGPERIGSHAGLITLLSESPCRLILLDECGRFLQTTASAATPHLFNVNTVMMQLYSSAGTIWGGDAYAESKKNKTIDQPHLCIYGTSVPEGFFGGMSVDNLSDGLIARLVVIETQCHYSQEQEPGEFRPPDRLVNGTRRLWGIGQGVGNLSDVHPEPLTVDWCDDALRRSRDYRRAVRERHDRETSQEQAIWARAGEKAGKLALIQACCRHEPGAPIEIELRDIDWAIALVNWSTRYLIDRAVGEVSDDPKWQKKLVRLEDFVASKGTRTRGEVCRHMRMRRKELDDLISCSLEMGTLEVDIKEGEMGRMVTLYSLGNGS